MIRHATEEDLAILSAIEIAAATLFPEGRIPDVNDATKIEDLQLALDRGLLLVATSQRLVVGFAAAHELDRCLHLMVVAVHPDHGNQGLGRGLVIAMLQEAAKRRLTGVTLTTFEDLPWNGPFYRKVGFRVLGKAELSRSLRDLLAQEERLGMTSRVAMLHALRLNPTRA